MLAGGNDEDEIVATGVSGVGVIDGSDHTTRSANGASASASASAVGSAISGGSSTSGAGDGRDSTKSFDILAVLTARWGVLMDAYQEEEANKVGHPLGHPSLVYLLTLLFVYSVCLLTRYLKYISHDICHISCVSYVYSSPSPSYVYSSPPPSSTHHRPN